MDPRGPPRPERSYAGGPAAHGGEASSSSSPPRRPPPPPPQQQQQQQQGHGIQPVCLRQPSPPRGLGAGALPFGFGPPVPWPTPPPHPQFGTSSSEGYPYPSAVDAGYLGGMGPHNWSGPFRPAVIPISNSDMVAAPQQMYAAQNWPPPPQFGPHSPWFVPLPPQPYVYVGGEHWGAPEPPIYQDPRVEEIKSELLDSPTTLGQLVMSPVSSAILVHQLDVGDKVMRERVLAGFKHCAHEIMENMQGHAVFEALLRSFHECHTELEIIVEAAVKPNLVSRSDDGVYSLELLITAVSGFPRPSHRLVDSFLNERVMDDVRGDELIVRCFTTMLNYVTTTLINHAMYTIDDKMESPSGSTFLTTCFGYAEGEEVQRFQTIILAKAVAMAKKRSGKYFLLRLLDHASIEFRRQLVSKLMENVLHLSLNCQGQFVVEHCFLIEEAGLLNIVLRACADLTLADLQMLVTQRAGRNLVPHLHRLLEEGNTRFPEIAKDLARSIEELSLHIREFDDLKPLMSAARRVLADNLPN